MSFQNSNVSNKRDQSPAKPNEKAHHLASMIEILQNELDGLQDNDSDSESSSSEAKSEKKQETDVNCGETETVQTTQLSSTHTRKKGEPSFSPAKDEHMPRNLSNEFAKIDLSKFSNVEDTQNKVSTSHHSSENVSSLVAQVQPGRPGIPGTQYTVNIENPEVSSDNEAHPAGKLVERDLSPLAAVTPINIDLSQSPALMLPNPAGNKVKIRFSPIGSITPLNKMVINASQPFSVIINFVKRKTNRKHVYLYINNSFAPSGQQLVGELYEHFRINDELWVSYCGGVAFG